MNTMDARTARRRPSWRTIATVVVVGLLGLAPSTASASDDSTSSSELVEVMSSSQCSSSYFCLWSGSSYTGSFTQASASTSLPAAVSTSRSVWNRTSKAVRVYSGTNATGTSVCYGPGGRSASTAITARSIVVQSGTGC